MPDTLTTTTPLFYPNGIDAATGRYSLEPLTEAQLAGILKGQPTLPEAEFNYLDGKKKQVELRQLETQLAAWQAQLEAATDPAQRAALAAQVEKAERQKANLDHLGVVAHVNAADLAQAGWGVIFAENDPQTPAILEALSELIDHRRQHCGDERLFKIFSKETDERGGYRPGDDYIKFLNRRGVAPGPVDPVKGVPYYLLIIGSPEAIPYSFQYQLDVQYAVGRIHFDSLDDYARYARSVVMAETGQVRLPRRASFFGVANPHDRPTEMSLKYLLEPLYQAFQGKDLDWTVDLIARDETTKARLQTLFSGGAQTPALLFTASHGVSFGPDDPRQRSHQGALLCQDWAGPEDHIGPLGQDLYWAGDDLDSQANLLGLMTFHFACYGAGTPQYDEFAGLRRQQKSIASRPFLADLPRQLLRHGALAAVGHVERAWSNSFFWAEAGPQTQVFESTLERLFRGDPIGLAAEYFNERYAELAVLVNEDLAQFDFRETPELPQRWTTCSDARNYIIIGDPAARLPLAEPEVTPTERPVVEIKPAGTKAQGGSPHAEFVAGGAEAAPLPKPLSSLSDEDWRHTPLAVQQALIEALAFKTKDSKIEH